MTRAPASPASHKGDVRTTPSCWDSRRDSLGSIIQAAYHLAGALEGRQDTCPDRTPALAGGARGCWVFD